MVSVYRKKPIEVQAMQWNETNYRELNTFVKNKVGVNGTKLFIRTLEGNMEFGKGDYIVKGLHGEFYPVKEDIFKDTYEVVK